MSRFLKVAATGLLSLLPSPAASADAIFKLTSQSFREGEWLAVKHGGNRSEIPACIGANISPQLSWSNVPAGTRSLVILMLDIEGNGGGGANHWVAYGIDPAKGGFAEGETSALASSYIAGKSTPGLGHYAGPCLSPGRAAHHYIWVVSATDYAPDALPAGLTKEEVAARLIGHSLGTAGLAARYIHP